MNAGRFNTAAADTAERTEVAGDRGALAWICTGDPVCTPPITSLLAKPAASLKAEQVGHSGGTVGYAANLRLGTGYRTRPCAAFGKRRRAAVALENRASIQPPAQRQLGYRKARRGWVA